MRRGFTLAILVVFVVCGFAGVRRVVTSCSLNRFVQYYQQMSRTETEIPVWEKLAASVALAHASGKQEMPPD